MAHPEDIYTKSLLINFYFVRSFPWPSILKAHLSDNNGLLMNSEQKGARGVLLKPMVNTAPRAILVLIL